MPQPPPVDWLTRGLAIAGAVTGIGAFAWNVIAWTRSGPIVRATAACRGRDSAMTISGRIVNKGRFEAQIDSVKIVWRSSGVKRTWSGAGPEFVVTEVPPVFIPGLALPHPLPAQAGTEYTITDPGSIDPGLKAALHDHRQATVRFTTTTNRRTRATLRYFP